jgi:hypothetical protein
MMFCVNDNEVPENPQPAESAESTPPAPDHTAAAGEAPPTPPAAAPDASTAAPAEPNVPAVQAPSTPASSAPVPHEPTAQPPALPVAPPPQPASSPAQASPPQPPAGPSAGAGGYPAPDAAAHAVHPGAPQPAGHPGAPQNPGGPHDPAAPPHDFGPNKKLTKGAWIGIIAGAVVALLVLAAIIVIPLISRGSAGSDGGGSDDGGSTVEGASTPAEFVEGYLTAVADGDAEAALAYVDPSGYNDDLLTDEVLKASLELGAIEDIEVGKPDKPTDEYDSVSVPATFTVGGEQVSTEFDVYQSSYDGEISMYDGLVSFSTIGFEGMGLTANGVELPDDGDSIAVFPGTYEFALGIEAFTLDGGPTFVLADDDDADALYTAEPVLSEQGAATFRELVTASIRECVAMKTLSTPCGFDINPSAQNGYTPVEGTATRALTAESEAILTSLVGEISGETVVMASEYFSLTQTVEAQDGAGARALFEVDEGIAFGYKNPKVDFAAEELTVVWE